MGQENQHWMNEPDIGSGARAPGQGEVEREEEALGRERQAETSASADGDEGQMLQKDNRLARVAARKLDDGSYEAQVYVRLTREPEAAETYIPAGNFGSEQEALIAARERAERALQDEEF